MSNNKNKETLNGLRDHVILTNFIEEGEEKRSELLAQPEAICNCPPCAAVCGGCALPCKGCEVMCDCLLECQIMGAAGTKTSSHNYNAIGFSKTSSGLAQVTVQTGDSSSNNSTGWWAMIGLNEE